MKKTTRKNTLTDQEQFFYDHAGYSYQPDRETQEEGRVRCSRAFAKAENWLISQPGVEIKWGWDSETNERGTDDTYLAYCIISVPGYLSESLFGIDLGLDGLRSPHCRVVAAELAYQMMNQRDE